MPVRLLLALSLLCSFAQEAPANYPACIELSGSLAAMVEEAFVDAGARIREVGFLFPLSPSPAAGGGLRFLSEKEGEESVTSDRQVAPFLALGRVVCARADGDNVRVTN